MINIARSLEKKGGLRGSVGLPGLPVSVRAKESSELPQSVSLEPCLPHSCLDELLHTAG